MRQEIRKSYMDSEIKLKFKNKGLIFLIRQLGEDAEEFLSKRPDQRLKEERMKYGSGSVRTMLTNRKTAHGLTLSSFKGNSPGDSILDDKNAFMPRLNLKISGYDPVISQSPSVRHSKDKMNEGEKSKRKFNSTILQNNSRSQSVE